MPPASLPAKHNKCYTRSFLAKDTKCSNPILLLPGTLTPSGLPPIHRFLVSISTEAFTCCSFPTSSSPSVCLDLPLSASPQHMELSLDGPDPIDLLSGLPLIICPRCKDIRLIALTCVRPTQNVGKRFFKCPRNKEKVCMLRRYIPKSPFDSSS